LICGLAPALQASKPDLTSALKAEAGAETRRRLNLRGVLVVAQIATSFVLLVCAGLFVRSLQRLSALDPGFRIENGFALPFRFELQGYDKTKGASFMRQITERVAALPGVESVSSVNFLPLGFEARSADVIAPDGGEQVEGAGLQITGLDYFRTMGTPLL